MGGQMAAHAVLRNRAETNLSAMVSFPFKKSTRPQHKNLTTYAIQPLIPAPSLLFLQMPV